MGKRKSQIELAIDTAQAEVDQLQVFIERLKDQQARISGKPKHKPLKAISKRRLNSEGATTDSGNLNYPPA